ncbi:ATP-binding protein [Saccharothrix coeruleofusca]|uniref:ATP-binding protein n=1 Tax=Saccharothrix coeruleofusca TaxID=33919 RepID=UPI00167020DA|nr:tetratricopeptide repeat protein [Saccharothrix coeruleofusca]MBP2334050.1 tetratricopeptide (TPR) repeat protein [Saccharothrix coeruleofusca]
MEFKILGKTRLRIDGNDFDLGPARQRGVLTMLLYYFPRPVQVDTMAQVLWPASVANDVRKSLQPIISKLRAVLRESQSGGSILKEGNAYRLLLPEIVRIDFHQFHKLATEGRAAAARGDHRVAKSLLREALSLWSGRPLQELEGMWAERLRDQMETYDRLPALHMLLDSQLHLGEHAEVMAVAGRLTEDQIPEEATASLYLRALDGLGKYSTALDFYGRFCQNLFDHVGSEPGPVLRTLYQSILRKQSGTGTSTAPPQLAPPRQLPLPAKNFAGRQDLLAKLDALHDATGGERGHVVALHGMPGVGKSRLAAHWANLRADRFPDGHLHLELRGFSPGTPMTPDDALAILLRSLGADRIPATGDERRVELHRLMANRRMLVLLDDAQSSNQVRPILAATPSCFTIVTSRTRPWGLPVRDNVDVILVPPLSHDESILLLRNEIGDQRADEDPAALRDFASRLDGLPLGLRIIAQHVAHRPETPVADLVNEFKEQEGLGILGSVDDSDDENATLPVAFSWSYRALSPETARLFRLLGLHPTAEFSTAAASALLGEHDAATNRHLRTLTKVNLLQYGTSRRFRLHDLLHGYAVDLVRHEESPQSQKSALTRLLDWYLNWTSAAARSLNPHRSPVPPLVGMSVSPEPDLHDEHDGLAWFTRERMNLVMTVPHAVRHTLHEHAWRLSANMHEAFDRLGYYDDLLLSHRAALKSARVLGHAEAHGGTLSNLGMTHFRLRQYQQATQYMMESLDIVRRLGLRELEVICIHNLASILLEQGETSGAIARYRQALELTRKLGDRGIEASTLDQLGTAYHRLGNDDIALEYYFKALHIREEIGHRRGQGTTLTELGRLLFERGEHIEALKRLSLAVDINQSTGDRPRTIEALVAIAEINFDFGEFEEAVAHAQQAASLSSDIGARDQQARALHVLGHALLKLELLEDAERCWSEAYKIFQSSSTTPEADVVHNHLTALRAQLAIPNSRIATDGTPERPAAESTKHNH